MNATLCEECLTRTGTMSLVFDDEVCRRCGHKPDREALTRGDVVAIVREKREATT